MGDTTTTSESTQRTEVDEAKPQENRAIQLLLQMAEQASAQMGESKGPDLSATAEDRRIINESIGSTADVARTELERTMTELMAGLDENLAGKGLQGSSIEAVKKGQVHSQGLQEIARMIMGAQQQGGQALLNLPMQREGLKQQMNAQLYQRLVGGAVPAATAGLNERLTAATRYGQDSQTTPFNPVQLISAGAQVGQAF